MFVFIALLAAMFFVNAYTCAVSLKKYKESRSLKITKNDNVKDGVWTSSDGLSISLSRKMSRVLSKKGEISINALSEPPKESYIPQALLSDDVPGPSEVYISVVLGLIFATLFLVGIL